MRMGLDDIEGMILWQYEDKLGLVWFCCLMYVDCTQSIFISLCLIYVGYEEEEGGENNLEINSFIPMSCSFALDEKLKSNNI